MKICACKQILEKIRNNVNLPLYLLFVITFLMGMLIGFLLSPVKKGITIGSFNTLKIQDDDEEN